MVTVTLPISTQNHARAIEIFDAHLPGIHDMPGCLSYRMVTNHASPPYLEVHQSWVDQASFDSYRADPVFAALGAGLKPLLSALPETRVYTAEQLSA
ncbi:MAG: antibiotic biosynthesis monooxygenase [Pseudomonadota bacterium]